MLDYFMKRNVAGASAREPATESAGLAGFPPGYFALVMASGIVSLAFYYQDWTNAARTLFWLNIAAYAVLWALTAVRLVYYRREFMDDLTHSSRSAGFLTLVAGTCVLGCQFAILTPWVNCAEMLWFVGGVLWLVLNYTFFAGMIVRNPKPSLEAGINGLWLLAVVATESISILGTLVAPSLVSSRLVLFVALATCLAGAMLYVFFITLILYRWIFFRMRPEKLSPDYWIDMGALAIVTLSGTMLLSVADDWSFLRDLKPFLMGFTLFFWATATWWIPLLSIIEIWRHAWGHVSFVYSADYWSLVFPLGMYSVATAMLDKVANLPFLHPIAMIFAGVAALAWGFTCLGLIRNATRQCREGIRKHLQV